MSMTMNVVAFDHAHAEPPMALRGLLGGKGANLAEMTSVLDLPVPPGFTISTDVCRTYLKSGWPDDLDGAIATRLDGLQDRMGRILGDATDPLLVSVRSGAEVSMPGMLDTVLNLGLNDKSVEGLAAVTGDERFAFDSYRRFIQMFSQIVKGVTPDAFEEKFAKALELADVEVEGDVPADLLRYVCGRFLAIYEAQVGEPFPQDPIAQLHMAIETVFSSWNGARAIAHRNREGISHSLGTAVNIQAMVFGNKGGHSGTGVGFTRNPSTGENVPYGDFLVNAQGEDVVAGAHTTEDIDALRARFPDIYDELIGLFGRLEAHYRDMCDVEFTIEQGKLWILQTRVGKRGGVAALRMAKEMTAEPGIELTRAEAVNRITADHLEQVLHSSFEEADREVLATGLAASPGAAVGKVVLTAEAATNAKANGEDVILVRQETSPEDVHGMAASVGILTSRGGLVSHAAVVARGWGTPAVCGADGIHLFDDHFEAHGRRINEGDVISLDGSTGEVILGALEMVGVDPPPEFDEILSWADDIRRGKMSVRTNADTGEDATVGRDFGAEGIGLCRTEHMFLGEDRLPIVRQMILANSPAREKMALSRLRMVQRDDFIEILEAMDG
ncbi:MAG: pyruvate, phosphate dikinase, partial [Actinomycetota bacterium]|nr:pyruvate, phosphate dikinase [Actinomycetota bacterium]